MSNELTTSTKENTISSREVAEMMGVRHCDLLEKIDSISKDLATENSVAKLQYSNELHDNNDIDENIFTYHAE